MTTDFTDAEKRLAAIFLADTWRSEYSRLRRRPAPHEVAIAARVAAEALVRRAQGDKVIELPRLARSPLFRLLGEGSVNVDVPATLAEQAATTLRYLNTAGNNPKATAASSDIDRRVFDGAVRMFRTTGRVNDTEIGREVGISHTQARERKVGRAARIAAALHRDCPLIWGPQGRPVIENLVAPDKNATAWRQAA